LVRAPPARRRGSRPAARRARAARAGGRPARGRARARLIRRGGRRPVMPHVPLARPLAAAVLLLALVVPARADDWPVYGGDPGGMRWSPHDQIRRDNVTRLERVWAVRTGDLDVEPPPPRHMAFQATPIVVDGLLVLPTPLGRVLALDPETGARRGRFDPNPRIRKLSEFTSRGVAAWTDAQAPAGAFCARRIFAATVESRLFALDAASGRRCPDFGRDGEVSLREGV